MEQDSRNLLRLEFHHDGGCHPPLRRLSRRRHGVGRALERGFRRSAQVPAPEARGNVWTLSHSSDGDHVDDRRDLHARAHGQGPRPARGERRLAAAGVHERNRLLPRGSARHDAAGRQRHLQLAGHDLGDDQLDDRRARDLPGRFRAHHRLRARHPERDRLPDEPQPRPQRRALWRDVPLPDPFGRSRRQRRFRPGRDVHDRRVPGLPRLGRVQRVPARPGALAVGRSARRLERLGERRPGRDLRAGRGEARPLDERRRGAEDPPADLGRPLRGRGQVRQPGRLALPDAGPVRPAGCPEPAPPRAAPRRQRRASLPRRGHQRSGGHDSRRRDRGRSAHVPAAEAARARAGRCATPTTVRRGSRPPSPGR